MDLQISKNTLEISVFVIVYIMIHKCYSTDVRANDTRVKVSENVTWLPLHSIRIEKSTFKKWKKIELVLMLNVCILENRTSGRPILFQQTSNQAQPFKQLTYTITI